MSFKSTLICVTILTVYVLIGMPIFYFVESPAEQKIQDSFQKTYDLFFQNYMDENQSISVNMSELQNLLDLIAGNPTQYFQRNTTINWLWNLPGSLFFSLVLVSTTGFGNQVPTTVLGQQLVILYSAIGIPIYLTTTSTGAQLTRDLLKKVESHFPSVWKKILIAISFILVNFILLIIIPSIIFMNQENWDYHTSAYFCYIAVTTIGFGDYVPGNRPSTGVGYKVFIFLWFFSGLSFMAMITGYGQTVFSGIFDKLFTKADHQDQGPRSEKTKKHEKDNHPYDIKET